MTTAFAALLIGVAVAALLLALGAYLWVNRTPSTRERFDEHGRVPLFGVDLTGSAPQPSTPRSSPLVRERELHEPVLISPHERRPGVSIDELVETHGGKRADNGADPRVLLPPAIADATPADPLVRASQRAHPDGDSRAPVSTNAPAWPVDPDSSNAPTPRYVASVSGVPDISHFAAADRQAANGQASSTGTSDTHVYGDGVPGHMVEGHRLRYSTPVEGTLQFLPGRLEINSGLDTGREIRFVRVPGPNGIQVTFGRTEGPLYRHIQLRDQTVSREHARMTLLDSRWVLTNLSRTNPVAHNGRVLAWSEQQPLDDGDRVEMGEVIFSFRSR